MQLHSLPPPPVRQAFRRPAGAAPRGPPASRSRSPALLTGVGRVLPDEAPGQEPHRQRCGKEGSKQQVRGSLSISGSPRRRGAGGTEPAPVLHSSPLPDLPAPLPPSTANFTSLIPLPALRAAAPPASVPGAAATYGSRKLGAGGGAELRRGRTTRRRSGEALYHPNSPHKLSWRSSARLLV